MDPEIIKSDWSLDEKLKLFEVHSNSGNKWSLIAKILPGRTDNAIKNHFYSSLRRAYRKIYGKDAKTDVLKDHDNQLTSHILSNLKRMKKTEENRSKVVELSPEEPASPPSDYSPSESMLEHLHIEGIGLDLP